MARGRGRTNGRKGRGRAPSWRDVWKVIVNPADGSCGIYTLLQLLLVEERGMSASEAEGAIRLAAGTSEMRELLMMCRRRVVEHLRGSPDLALFFEDEGDAGSDIFTTAELKSLEEWMKATLKECSYIDGIAVLALGRIFGIPDVRIVYEVPGVGLVDCFNPNDAVEPTGQPTVLWSGGVHFEAVVPDAPDAGTKTAAGNDLGSVMEFCRGALNRPTYAPVDDGALVDAVISFVRRIPRRTGSEKRVHKTHGIRKWPRGRTPLTRGRVSRFRDICCGLRSIRGGGDCDDSDAPVIAGATVAPAAPVDAGLPPAAPEGWDDMQPQVAPAAPMVAESTLDAEVPGERDDTHVSDTHEAPVAPVASGARGASTSNAGRAKRNAKVPARGLVSAAGRQERNFDFFNKLLAEWQSKIGVVPGWDEERVAYEISCVQEEWDEARRKHELKMDEERLQRELDQLPCLACGKNDDIPNTLLCDKPIGDGRTCDNIYHFRCAGLKKKPRGDVSEMLYKQM